MRPSNDAHPDPALHADMIADLTSTQPATPAPATNASLASMTTTPTVPSPSSGHHPDQHWNGRRETLGSWFTEFETGLAAVSPDLHEFAVEFFVMDRSKTIIFHAGQAAQLDGALLRARH